MVGWLVNEYRMIYRKAWLGIHAEPPVTPISSDETPASILLNLKQMHLTVLPVLTLIPQSPAWGQPVDLWAANAEGIAW